MSEGTNDNTVSVTATAREPDAYGHAAMLLVESLIHGLIARSVLSVSEAVEIVESATEVRAEIAVDRGDSVATLRRSLALLESISTSLRPDAGPKAS